MKFSKNARPGTMVVKHGDKYVRLGKQKQRGLIGVRVETERLVFVTDRGRQEVKTPAGVQVYGPVIMRVASE